MELVRSLLEAILSYLREHPQELVRALRNALGLRFGLPLAALSWVARRAPAADSRDIVLEAVPPGVCCAGTFDLMKTKIRCSTEIYVESVRAGPKELRIELRLANTDLKILDDTSESPLATLLRSGALDLSKPGNLLLYMPKRPKFVVEAHDDRIVLDLMLYPKLAQDRWLRRILGLITPLITVSSIETDEQHLDVALRAFPGGVSEALEGLKRAI